MMRRLTLNAEDFRILVSGGVVEACGVVPAADDIEIILGDVGFREMLTAIHVAQSHTSGDRLPAREDVVQPAWATETPTNETPAQCDKTAQSEHEGAK